MTPRGRERVSGECALARRPFARAVTAIVQGDDRPFARPARVGKREGHFLGIAAEIDDRRGGSCASGDAPAARLRAFYDTWYRPDHMAVVAGMIFFAVRAVFALLPAFSNRHPIKKCVTAVEMS